jgi:fatty acid desaturase
LLRHAADLRTLAYLALTVGLSILQWNLEAVNPGLYALGLFMAVTVAVISHNHNHLGIWKSRTANLLTSYVIALYYGAPAFVWVPTHNQVHHKLTFAEGDSSRGPKGFRGNHLQHVETHVGSRWNHSRNFVSPLLDALLFNNGLHTVHHWKPGVHWSEAPALHAAHAHRIHPDLLVKSWWGYMVRTFLVRPFRPGAARPPVFEDSPGSVPEAAWAAPLLADGAHAGRGAQLPAL